MGSGSKKHVEYFTVQPAGGQATQTAAADAQAVPAAEDTGSDTSVAAAAEADGQPSGAGGDIDTAGQQPLQAVTPVPDELQAGAPTGEPLLVGGADLQDSMATLVAYQHPDGDGPVEVLHARVEEDAQSKLLEAVALSDEKLIPVAVDKQVNGRLPVDENRQLYEQLETVVKSVNYHLKKQDGIPEHTRENFHELAAELEELDGQVTDAEQAMVEDYQAGLEQIEPRLDPDFDVPYQDGGKVGWLAPHETTSTVTVTEHVPAPSEEVPEGLLPATVRSATRLDAELDGNVACWDGHKRSETDGIEYAVDLGGGFEAVYRPRWTDAIDASDKPAAGQRGHLEVVAPAGGGNADELVDRLGQLNLVNRPMNRSEAEWAYLKRNIWAQQLDTDPQVAQALESAKALADTHTELVFNQRADQATQLADGELAGFARDIRLEAEARALPDQVRVVREAAAASAGYKNGQALAGSAGYDPTPRRSGGWFVFDRWDVAGNPDGCTDSFDDKVLYHRVTGNNPAEMINNGGVLACTERRRTMGTAKGLGKSESSDVKTGGSQAVDLRVGTPSSHGCQLVWDDPGRLLRRADWYAYPNDHFAAAVDEGGHTTSGQTRNPTEVAGWSGGSNEVLFRNGIDLTGAEAPDRIITKGSSQRESVLGALKNQGVTHLAGRPIEEAVQ